MLPIAIRVLAATGVELSARARPGRACVGRAQGAGGRREGARLNDILAGQPADASLLAEIYDLEHDAIDEDLAFYRQMARRHPGPVIDLGCGSGRLFGPLLAGGATELVGVDGSPSLLERAHGTDRRGRAAARRRAAGRIELAEGDVRRVRRRDRFALAILAGVVAHLDGPEDALRALAAARRLLRSDGVLVVDTLGPGGLPRARSAAERRLGAR